MIRLAVVALLLMAEAQSPFRWRKPADPISGAATLPTDTNQVFLSEVSWSLGTNGFGPAEIDESNGESGVSDGTTCTLAGLTYSRCLGVHATSRLYFELNQRCTAFKAVLGVDDETGSSGSVQFKVYGTYRYTRGTTLLYTSSVLTGSSASVPIDIDVTSKSGLILEVTDGGDGDAADHGDWAFPRVICTVPTYNTAVTAGSDIQAALTAGSTNQIFLLRAGTHTITTPLSFKAGQGLVGELGTRLYGGLALTSWTQTTTGCAAGCWYASGLTFGTDITPDTTLCRQIGSTGVYYPCEESNDVFIDREPLTASTSLAQMNGVATRFFFDHTADRVYVATDPTNRQVEIQRYSSPFTGSASGVTLKYLTIEFFTGNGVNLSTGWTLENSEVRYNHTDGVHMDSTSTVRRSYIHHSGYQNFGGQGADLLIEYVEHSYGNYANYNPYWGGGGSKFVFTTNLRIENNYTHDNYGVSWWADISNADGTIAYNQADNDERACIFWELSYEVSIHDNSLQGCGLSEHALYEGFGAAIQGANSRGMTVYNNVIADSGNGIKCIHFNSRMDGGGDNTDGPWECTNFQSYGNTVCLEVASGQVNGVESDQAGAFSTKGNSLGPNNVYQTVASSPQIHWDGEKTLAQAQAAGQESGSTHTVVGSCAAL